MGASIGKAVYAKLSADSAVTALATTILANDAPKRSSYPQVIYEGKDKQFDAHYGGNSGVVQQKMVVRCICKSSYSDQTRGYKQCDALANAVTASLDQAAGVLGGVTVQRIFFEDDAEDQFKDQDSEEILYLVRELSFEIWFNNS